MRVLVTGGLGLVGRAVVRTLVDRGHPVRVFDAAPGSSRRLIAVASRRSRTPPAVELVRGNLCRCADVGEAVRGVDAVIHLGAVIPPAADREPLRAAEVNVGGTRNVVDALCEAAPHARIVFASSVAIYGDRRSAPLIRVDDPPNPGKDDCYAHQKLLAESIVRDSGLAWVVMRLSYVVSPRKLAMDPLLFSMPLDTSLEICTVHDTALALVNAITADGVVGRVLNIAGGERCRTTFRNYLNDMTELFGLGRGLLPEDAFSTSDFHCGFMDTAESEALLRYQMESLDDYYVAVARAVRGRRRLLRSIPALASIARRYVRARLLAQSPHTAFRPPRFES